MFETPSNQHLTSDKYEDVQGTDTSSENEKSRIEDRKGKIKNQVLRPEDYCYLFDFPTGAREDHARLIQKIESIVEVLQDRVIFANVRDDCSLLPKKIMLRLPNRKQTH
jgi:hypothetical protein